MILTNKMTHFGGQLKTKQDFQRKSSKATFNGFILLLREYQCVFAIASFLYSILEFF